MYQGVWVRVPTSTGGFVSLTKWHSQTLARFRQLDDAILEACQAMLKSAHPGLKGLQLPRADFACEPKGLQIHMGYGHISLSCGLLGSPFVVDTLNSPSPEHQSVMKKQLKAIYRRRGGLDIPVIRVQAQTNVECGVRCVAYAVELAIGSVKSLDDLSKLNFAPQKKLYEHLISCLELPVPELSPFPKGEGRLVLTNPQPAMYKI